MSHSSASSDVTGINLGMWLFLFTEIMLFGGLFVLYAGFFHAHPEGFKAAGKKLDLVMGAVNTVILLVSSFAVAASITSLRRKNRKGSIAWLVFSLFLACGFLVIKYFEWGHKIHQGIYPGSDTLKSGPAGENIFYTLYYGITGLHGAHVLIGMTLLLIAAVLIQKNTITPERYVVLDNCGLYWHLVDLIWIFVFPLFYLVP